MQSKSFRGRHKSKTILQTASLLEWNWQHDCGMKPQPPSSLPYYRRGVILERVSNDWVFKTPTLFNLIEEKQSFRAKRTSHVGSLLTSLYWARPCVHPEMYHAFRPIRACVTSWLCYKTFLRHFRPSIAPCITIVCNLVFVCLFFSLQQTTHLGEGWGYKRGSKPCDENCTWIHNYVEWPSVRKRSIFSWRWFSMHLHSWCSAALHVFSFRLSGLSLVFLNYHFLFIYFLRLCEPGFCSTC